MEVAGPKHRNCAHPTTTTTTIDDDDDQLFSWSSAIINSLLSNDIDVDTSDWNNNSILIPNKSFKLGVATYEYSTGTKLHIVFLINDLVCFWQFMRSKDC